MIDLTEVLATLAKQRPIFHSEADFQHALAWAIHEQLPEASIRLELPVSIGGNPIHLDLWIVYDKQLLALELKYKTRALKAVCHGEQFHLINHSARDVGRYDFIKDIQRLEHLLAGQHPAVGYAVFLTNDSSYWKPARQDQFEDSDFRIHEGRVLHGVLNWSTRTSAGTMHRRESSLQIDGEYPISWKDYSVLPATGYGRFRYAMVEVHRTFT